MCLLDFDLCMETSVRAGSQVILISKQSTLNSSPFFWFLCSASDYNVRTHRSGFDRYRVCFSSSGLFCDYPLAVEGDIFAGGGCSSTAGVTEMRFMTGCHFRRPTE